MTSSNGLLSLHFCSKPWTDGSKNRLPWTPWHRVKGLTLWVGVLSKGFLRPWKVQRFVWKFPRQNKGPPSEAQVWAPSKEVPKPVDSTIDSVHLCISWYLQKEGDKCSCEALSAKDSCDLGLWALFCFSMLTCSPHNSSGNLVWFRTQAFQSAKFASWAFWRLRQGPFFALFRQTFHRQHWFLKNRLVGSSWTAVESYNFVCSKSL